MPASGFSMSPVEDDIRRLEAASQTLMLKSISHMDFDFGRVNNRILALWILNTTPVAELKRIYKKYRRGWMLTSLAEATERYRRYCKGAEFDKALSPLRQLESITVAFPESDLDLDHASIPPQYVEFLDDPRMTIYTKEQWKRLPSKKFREFLDTLCRLPYSISLKHLCIESFPIDSLSRWDRMADKAIDTSAGFSLVLRNLQSVSLGISSCIPNGPCKTSCLPSLCDHYLPPTKMAAWNLSVTNTLANCLLSMKHLTSINLTWQISGCDELHGCLPPDNAAALLEQWNDVFFKNTWPALMILRISEFEVPTPTLLKFLSSHKKTLKRLHLGRNCRLARIEKGREWIFDILRTELSLEMFEYYFDHTLPAIYDEEWNRTEDGSPFSLYIESYVVGKTNRSQLYNQWSGLLESGVVLPEWLEVRFRWTAHHLQRVLRFAEIESQTTYDLNFPQLGQKKCIENPGRIQHTSGPWGKKR
ncbi:hypothetical protein NHQ30_010820 [Ciborinia camelliae]|nr:hypothetical protein NHQ30_010820 [Ciborinia camelliae]